MLLQKATSVPVRAAVFQNMKMSREFVKEGRRVKTITYREEISVTEASTSNKMLLRSVPYFKKFEQFIVFDWIIKSGS